jgi:hypothetical protein
MKDEIEEDKITYNSAAELNERLDFFSYLFLYFSKYSKDKLKI